MKKNSGNRILGRRLARVVPNRELGRAAAALTSLDPSVGSGTVWTYTLLYPSDPTPPRDDSPQPGGPIYV